MLESAERKAGVFLPLHTKVITAVPMFISLTVDTKTQIRDSLTKNFTVTNRLINNTERKGDASDSRASGEGRGFNWTPMVPNLKNVTCAFLHPKVSK